MWPLVPPANGVWYVPFFCFALRKIEAKLLDLYFLPAGCGTGRTKTETLNPEMDYLSLDFFRERNKHRLCLTQCNVGTVCYRSWGGHLSNIVAIVMSANQVPGRNHNQQEAELSLGPSAFPIELSSTILMMSLSELFNRVEISYYEMRHFIPCPSVVSLFRAVTNFASVKITLCNGHQRLLQNSFHHTWSLDV